MIERLHKGSLEFARVVFGREPTEDEVNFFDAKGSFLMSIPRRLVSWEELDPSPFILVYSEKEFP
jgi:hypothetical protein